MRKIHPHSNFISVSAAKSSSKFHSISVSWSPSISCLVRILLLANLGLRTTAAVHVFADAVDRLYTFENVVRLNEVNNTNTASDLAFQTDGNVWLSKVWQNSADELEMLLQFRLQSLKITLIDYRQNSTWKITHNQKPVQTLDHLKNDVFLAHWKKFKIVNVYLDPDEEISLRNIKKSLTSLFQFQTQHIHVEESDICGSCSVTYEPVDAKSILKTKTNCISHLPDNQHPEKMLGTSTNINRRILYQFSDQMSELIKATMYESVDLSVYVKQEIGASATVTMDLNLLDTRTANETMLPNDSLEKATAQFITDKKLNLKAEPLYIVEEPIRSTIKPLPKVIKENREFLKSGNLGNVKSAAAFLAVLKSVWQSPEAEITKILKNKKNEPIIEQLMDILGSAQTLAAHNAVMKHFNFAKPVELDAVERYLWSLSIARKPKIEFVQDLKNAINQKPNNEKLLDSLVLCLTAMSRKISNQAALDAYSFVLGKISECKTDDHRCTVTYIRALKNLQNAESKSLLLDYALNGTRSISVNALKVLYALPPSVWDEQVLKAMERIYYQKDKKYDSSSRAIAVDILIEANPTEETLRHLMRSLQSHTISFEIRKYLLQRLNQLASDDKKFSKKFKRLMKEENLNHYGVVAQRGLSNALTRTFSEDPSVNATLFCINEVSKAVLKRGHVSVALQRFNDTLKVGALDIFTGGLSSFLWSDDTSIDDETDEPEELTAGLEASVLGVQIRPFVFFNGHGELMGHIWSGTASEKTTALQGTALLHEADQMIALGTGNILKFQLTGAASYDLSGQIQFSLWNRNAHAFVEAEAGGSIEGTLNISSAFIKNGIDFKVYSQQKGEMTGDLDFYDEVAFCLRISQLDSVVRFVGEKYQKLVDTKFVRKQKKRLKLVVPGRTFALNQKNNEMCNDILRNQPS